MKSCSSCGKLWLKCFILVLECLLFISCTDVGKQSIRKVMLVNHSDDFLLNKQLILQLGQCCHSHSSCTEEFQEVAKFYQSANKYEKKNCGRTPDCGNGLGVCVTLTCQIIISIS